MGLAKERFVQFEVLLLKLDVLLLFPIVSEYSKRLDGDGHATRRIYFLILYFYGFTFYFYI